MNDMTARPQHASAATLGRPDVDLAGLPMPVPHARAQRPDAASPAPTTATRPDNSLIRIEARRLTALFSRTIAVKEVSLFFPTNTVTAIIGPSGCGKSTFLRCLNRMHELSPGGWVTGSVLLDGADIYSGGLDPVAVRRRVGMVFQRPTPFPTMSIYDNVAAGLRVGGRRTRAEVDGAVERALHQAALWDEVKDRLHTSAMALSGGQQQRLCIARAVAPLPEVLLLDEPTASLDPAGTQRIEELCRELKSQYTIVIVTHNMQQAARVSDYTAFFYMGELIEIDRTSQMFTNPAKEQTEAYLTGRFG
jgi:phosphate transport system ATP-binding protein